MTDIDRPMNRQQLVIHLLYGGPLFVSADEGKNNEMAEWLLNIIDQNGVAIFKNDDDDIQSVVRGSAIAAFGFEPVGTGIDPEFNDLHRRRLRAEVKLMEKSIDASNQPREGDEWKTGGY